MAFARLTVFALMGALAAAQAASFEVASIKPRQRGLQPPQTRMLVVPGRISFDAVLLADCLRWAYGLADYQMSDCLLQSVECGSTSRRELQDRPATGSCERCFVDC